MMIKLFIFILVCSICYSQMVSWNSSNIIWQSAVPGKGNSSPIVHGDKIFLTTAIEIKTNTNAFNVSERNKYCIIHNAYQSRLVMCFEKTTGKELWRQEVSKDIPDQPIHPKNSFATETPSTDGERVYVFFGNVGMFCYDLNGNLLWNYKVKSTRVGWDWGKSSSPYLYKDKIIIVDDNQEKSFIVILDSKTGKEIVKTNRTEGIGGWSNPIVVDDKIIVPASAGVAHGNAKIRSYDFSLDEMWAVGDLSPSMVIPPIAYKDLIIICSGHNSQSYRPMIAIKDGKIIWTNNYSTYVPTPVIYKNRLYTVYDNGTFACFKPDTGERIYSVKLASKVFTASMWAYDDRIFCLDESGNTYVIKHGDTFRIECTNTIKDYTLATPAIVKDGLIFRGYNRIYFVGKK